MSKITTFFNTNKVLILGLLAAIAAVLQQFISEPTVNWVIVGYAIAAAVASYFANNLRGQWASISTIAGTVIATIATAATNGNKISWPQIVLQAIVAILGIVAPPAKSLSYETSDVISTAKQEAATIDTAKGVSAPVTSTTTTK